jgi:hypothetical protein
MPIRSEAHSVPCHLGAIWPVHKRRVIAFVGGSVVQVCGLRREVLRREVVSDARDAHGHLGSRPSSLRPAPSRRFVIP